MAKLDLFYFYGKEGEGFVCITLCQVDYVISHKCKRKKD